MLVIKHQKYKKINELTFKRHNFIVIHIKILWTNIFCYELLSEYLAVFVPFYTLKVCETRLTQDTQYIYRCPS